MILVVLPGNEQDFGHENIANTYLLSCDTLVSGISA